MQISDIHFLQIEPTTYCNAKCPHCARFDESGNLHPSLKLGHLNVDEISKNLELKKMIGLTHVCLEGDKGDPLMHPEIEKILDLFCNAPSMPRVDLVTNGSIRNTQWWENLAKKQYKNLNVIFSIDGLRDTNHLYRVGLDYDKIIANVETFISAGGDAVWKFILFKHNEHQLTQIIEKSKSMGFLGVWYTTCRSGEFRGLSRWPVMVNNQLSHYLEPPTEAKEGMKYHTMPKNRIKFYKQKPEKICPNLADGHVYITYLNQVIPCCMMHFDTTLDYPGLKRLSELSEGFDNQDLTKFSMSEILDHPLFNNNLIESLKNGKWHRNCANSCKTNILNNLKHVNP